MPVAQQALPDRYEVHRRGTPDPATARYYVLDMANDFAARVALRTLVRGYRLVGRSAAAHELEEALDATQHDFADLMRRQNDERAAASKKVASKTRSKKSVPMS